MSSEHYCRDCKHYGEDDWCSLMRSWTNPSSIGCQRWLERRDKSKEAQHEHYS